MKNYFCLFAVALTLFSCKRAQDTVLTVEPDYYFGADISWTSSSEANGVKYYNWEGESRDGFSLMKEMGMQAVRLRVWVDPSAHGGWCDMNDMLSMAKRAHDLDMEVLLSLHYSDWWSDPAKQNIPESWRGHSYDEMREDLANHTKNVINLLKENGITPKWVQVGNEVSNGLLWSVVKDERGWEVKDENGKTTITESMGHVDLNPEQFAGFIEAGYQAVKEVSPETKVIVHLDNGFDNDLYNKDFDILKENGAHWDMIGMSLYPYWAISGGYETDADTVITKCMENIRLVSAKYDCDVMIVETGFEVDEEHPEVMAEGRRLLNRAVRESRDETGGRCKGIFYWEPMCNPKMYKLGAFYGDGRPTEIMKAFQDNVVFANQNIKNDVFWHCTDGTPIYSQGGGIFRFYDLKTAKERYFWYGVHYKEAELYAADPAITHTQDHFESVTCYVSDDLVNWESRGDVLTKEEVNAQVGHPTWVGRMGVAKVDSVYALFVQCGSNVLVAESSSPDGEYKWARLIDMTDRIGTPNTGDQTVFTDEDTGKSYLVYSYGRGRHRIYVSEIGRTADGTIGLLDCTEVFSGSGREGNCMFKYGGKYYLCASNLYGWDCSYAYFLVADSLEGPYREAIADYEKPVNEYPVQPDRLMQVMPGSEKDYAHITQTGFFYTLRRENRELVVYCGDRWADFAGNGLGYNQWFPLSFDEDIPHFNSLSSWNLDAQRAIWTMADDNNFVLNGSFEADRRVIPQKEKPRQDFLTGWNTEFIKGNVASVDDDDSPRLNYEKTQQERVNAIGEKALLITDNTDFCRRVSQTIESTPTVALPDGIYSLTAKVKCSGKFSQLFVYAETGGETYKTAVCEVTAASGNDESEDWQTVKVEKIAICGGKAIVGIYAEGEADSRCLVDDVCMVRENVVNN